MTEKTATSIRISPEAKRLLKELSRELGISQAAVIEIAIREYARDRLLGHQPGDKAR